MMKKYLSRLSGFFTRNKAIKVMSLVGAVIVWMLIMNIEDPVKQRTFRVNVKTINADAIESVNMVYEIKSGSVARVRVSAKKSILDHIRLEDITATADLSDLSNVNAVNVVPHIRGRRKGEVELRCDDVLKVSLEEKESKQIQVEVQTSGEPAEGHSIGECVAKPNMIEVSGGGSVIDKIESVKVYLNIDNATSSFSRSLTPAAYDEYDHKIQSATLSFSVKKIKVTAQITDTKTVPVRIKVTGTPREGYEFAGAECLPKKVEISGSWESLDNVSEVVIPVDITGLDSKSDELEQNIGVQDYLDDGIQVISDYAMISVKLDIEKIKTQKFSISKKQIDIRNLSDGLYGKITGDKDINVGLTGVKKEFKDLDASKMSFYVDASGLGEGKYQLELKSDDDITFAEKTEVNVKITGSSDSSGTGDKSENTEKSDDGSRSKSDLNETEEPANGKATEKPAVSTTEPESSELPEER